MNAKAGDSSSLQAEKDRPSTSVALVEPKELEESLLHSLRAELRPDQIPTLRIAVSQAVSQTTTLFRGPLPHPEHFGQYNQILPGSAERILAMAEKEQGHRHIWESKHLKWDGVMGIVGLAFGWLLSLALVAGAVHCAIIGQPWVAVTLTGFAAFGGVANLVRGKRLFGKADHDVGVPETPQTPQKKVQPKGKKR